MSQESRSAQNEAEAQTSGAARSQRPNQQESGAATKNASTLLERRLASAMERAFATPEARELFGGDSGRAIELIARYRAGGKLPFLVLEFPLLGAPYYDVLLGTYPEPLEPGDTLAGRPGLPEPEPCQAAVAFTASRRPETALSLCYEFDAAGTPGQVPGILMGHHDQLDVADGFLEAVGESWRRPIHAAACERLPEGWRPDYLGFYPGRTGAAWTRLEASVSEEARVRMAQGPSAVREAFDELGFTAYTEAMCEQFSRLAGLSEAFNVQMDILEDGSLGPTLSQCSIFELPGQPSLATAPLFADGGHVAAVMAAYEQEGTADARWRKIEDILFARRGRAIDGGRLVEVTSFLLMCCSKAKWTGGEPMPSKFYLKAGVSAA